MTPFIQNCAADDIPKKFHMEPGTNAMLIQITDTGSWFPKPKHQFKEVHQFEFLDLEDGDYALEEEMKITDAQAAELVRLLQHALDNHMNVIVHCFAGVCRSGAVAEVGVMMGFRDSERWRSPNLRVKHKMMRVLGWTYDENEQHRYKPDHQAYYDDIDPRGEIGHAG
jgi:predicted protein tyrosine phosphatase